MSVTNAIAAQDSPRRTASRLRLLAAARARFAAQGYHATSVAQIVGDAGLAQGSFYNHFEDKRDIFGVVLREAVDGVVACLEDVSFADVHDRATYVDAGKRLASALTGYFFAHTDEARILLWEAPGLDAAAAAEVAEAYQRMARYSAAFLRHGQARGIVRPELVPEVIAHGLVGTAVHLTRTYMSGGLEGVAIERMAATILTAHLDGVLL